MSNLERDILVEQAIRRRAKAAIVCWEMRNGFRPGVLTPMVRDYRKSRLDQFADMAVRQHRGWKGQRG